MIMKIHLFLLKFKHFFVRSIYIFYNILGYFWLSKYTCLSEKDLVIMTCNKSSVGKSIPIYKKLSILDLKSSLSKV